MVIDYEVPMPRHTIDGRRSMRSVADAIEHLRVEHQFSDHSLAQIRTGPIRLPGGEVTSIVLVIGEPRINEPSCGVALPSSRYFSAKRIGGNSEKVEASRLDRAWVDSNGRVELSDGTSLCAVDAIPTLIHRELTEIQKRIVYWTIKFVGADAIQYPSGLPVADDLEFLDYSTLYGYDIPPLEEIADYIAEQDWTLRQLSRQTIANALSAAGMRRPSSRR